MKKVVDLVMCAKNEIGHETLYDSVKHQTDWNHDNHAVSFTATTDREVIVSIEVHEEDDILGAGVMFGQCLKSSAGLFENAYWMIGHQGETE